MTTNPSAPPAGRERAVLDPARVGDIHGAFGTIRQHEEAHRGLRSRALALLAIIGPGLIVMVGDNDAGGVSTYSQAGQNYGTSLLWVLLLLVPVLIVNQEMVVRLGAVTGVGHAKVIIERFGRGWGWFEAGYLFLMNFLIIVTEFIGVSLALAYFGVSDYISVPLGAAALVAVTATGSFRSWERSMFLFVFANLLVIPLFFMAHPRIGDVAHHLFVPGIRGAGSSLHRRFSEAKGFYAVFTALILVAAGVVLIPGAPLGLIVESVQALCGILLPMTTVFLLMLCNDREVLGPWANPPSLRAFA